MFAFDAFVICLLLVDITSSDPDFQEICQAIPWGWAQHQRSAQLRGQQAQEGVVSAPLQLYLGLYPLGEVEVKVGTANKSSHQLVFYNL